MKFNIPVLLRGFALLVVIFILLVAVIQFLPQPSAEEQMQATIAAGVAATTTAIVQQTGTPNSNQLQATVEAGIAATLNAPDATELRATSDAATLSAPTPVPLSPTEEIGKGAEGVLAWFWGIILAIWSFMGFGGIYTQVCCCLLPFALVVLGIANDR